MLDKIPDNDDLTALLGEQKFIVWQELCRSIESLYAITPQWNSGGKKWVYEYKYRKGGKTLCALYAKPATLGFMVIFGAVERNKFELERQSYSTFIQNCYDAARTYHDGKWIMLEISDLSCTADITRLLSMKRKPEKK
jgi:hypothetical protein